MAHTSGTASNHYDLLVRLKNYAVANGWTANRWTDDAGAATNGPGSLLNLQGPGVDASQRVYINIRTYVSTGASAYSWQMSASLGYGASPPWGSQAQESPSAYLNLWNASINYWFFVSDRRIIVVAKTSTAYVSAYLGFFLPWGNPVQYPSPLLVAGDYASLTTWSDSSTGRRMMCDPGGNGSTSSAYLRGVDGSWVPGMNSVGSGTNVDLPVAYSGGVQFLVAPWVSGPGSLTSAWGQTTLLSYTPALDRFVPTAQGERFVMPTLLLSTINPSMGTLDGVFATFGSGLSSETTVTVGARSFMAFQNVARNSGNDFFLVELI